MRKHSESVGQRRVLRLLAQRRRAVLERDDLEPALVGAAHGRFDTHVGEKAGQRHGLDALAPQDEIEVGARKGVKPTLSFDDDVFGVRLQYLDDGCAPRSLAKSVVVEWSLQ